MRLACTGPDEVFQAIGALGRTEDVAWSPSGRRIALAGIAADQLLVLGVQCSLGDGKAMHLTDALEVNSPSLERPHGVYWINETLLAVANREGNLCIFDVPETTTEVWRSCRLHPLATIDKSDTELLKSPGSLCARELGADLLELWVCNGFAHYVTHHLLDVRNGFAHLDAQVLMRHGLETPDGVALDPAGAWVAISNHDRHLVAMYRNDESLQGAAEPAAQLRGLEYPHGLCFAAGGRVLLVADAGAPHIAVYARDAQGWDKDMAAPQVLVQVLEEEAFRKGQHNPREGGPKGLDVNERWGVLVATCQQQPLAFFDLQAFLPPTLRLEGRAAENEELVDATSDGLRTAVLRLVRDAADREVELTLAVRNEAALLRSSWSWRVTAPLRALARGCLGLRALLGYK